MKVSVLHLVIGLLAVFPSTFATSGDDGLVRQGKIEKNEKRVLGGKKKKDIFEDSGKGKGKGKGEDFIEDCSPLASGKGKGKSMSKKTKKSKKSKGKGSKGSQPVSTCFRQS